MDVPIQYPWYRRAFSNRLPDMHSGASTPELALSWPFSWPVPWTQPSFSRRLSWVNCEHSEMNVEKDKYVIHLDVKHFSPEEISININRDFITIHGKHEERQDDHGFVAREFTRKYTLPEGTGSDVVTSSLSCDGVLTVSIPRGYSSEEQIIPITCEEGAAPQKK